MNLEDIIPDPQAREFLRQIDAERGHDVALGFLRDMVAGVWVYAGKSQLKVESGPQVRYSRTSKQVEGYEQEAML